MTDTTIKRHPVAFSALGHGFIFLRILGLKLEAGYSLEDAIENAVLENERERSRNTFREIAKLVKAGAPLSEALSLRADLFQKFEIHLIAKAEKSNDLPRMLQRLAEHKERSLDIHRQVYSMILYPAIMVFIAVVVITVLFAFVLPQFSELYREVGMNLPTMTQIVMTASDLFASWWWAILIVWIPGMVQLINRFKSNMDHPRLVNIPIIGPVFRHYAIFEMTGELQLLIEAGFSIPDAFMTDREFSSNRFIRQKLHEIPEATLAKGSLSACLAAIGTFPPSLIETIKDHEDSEEFDPCHSLSEARVTTASIVEEAVKGFVCLAEPVLIVFMGAVIGLIVLSLFLPTTCLCSSVKG